MKVTVSTSDAYHTDVIRHWAKLCCKHFMGVACHRSADPAGFCGNLTKHSFSQLEIAQIRANSHRMVRTAQQIKGTSLEWFLVTIQRQGVCRVIQGELDIVLRPHDCALYSSAQIYEIEFTEDFHQTVLIFPAPVLRLIDHSLDRACGLFLPGDDPAVRFVVALADLLYESGETLPIAAADATTNGLAHVLIAAISAQSLRAANALPNAIAYHLSRTKEYILRHLRDPTLSTRRIATDMGLSVSHLHRVFAADCIRLMDWVWAQRLEACRRDLSDAGKTHCSLSQLAYHWGFNDCSHFSRAFRRRFGKTPSDWRKLHLTETGVDYSKRRTKRKS